MAWKNKSDGGQFILIFDFSSVYSSESRTSFMIQKSSDKKEYDRTTILYQECILSKSLFLKHKYSY